MDRALSGRGGDAHRHREPEGRLHELARLADRQDGVRNYNVQVREGPDEIVFLRRIAPGSAGRSYGIHVARLAGVPRAVLDRAGQVLSELEGKLPEETGPTIMPAKRRKGPQLQAG